MVNHNLRMRKCGSGRLLYVSVLVVVCCVSVFCVCPIKRLSVSQVCAVYGS